MEEAKTIEAILDQDGHFAYTNRVISMRPLIRQGRDVMLIEKKETGKCF